MEGIIILLLDLPVLHLYVGAKSRLFKANAIQFGMDQLVVASSDQLSSFIHWSSLVKQVLVVC